MEVGPQVDHFLTGNGRLGRFSLFQQDIAKQAKSERQATLSNEGAGEGLGLFEPMKVMKHVAAQKHGFGTAGMSRFEAQGALFGEFVEPRIKTFTSLGDKSPTQPLDRHLEMLSRADLFLQTDDFLVQATVTGMWNESEGQR